METINDIVRKVAEEMLNTSMQDITAEIIYGWATRLGDAATCEKSSQVGNAAKRNCDRFESESEMKFAFIDWYNETFELKGTYYEIDTCDLKHDVDGILHEYINWLFAEAKGETK